MHVEIFLAVMVLAVALLVAADFFRRASEGPHEHADRPAHDAGPGSLPSRTAGAGAAGAGVAGAGAAGAGVAGAGVASAGIAGAGTAAAVTAFQPARTGRPGPSRPGSAGSGSLGSGSARSGSLRSDSLRSGSLGSASAGSGAGSGSATALSRPPADAAAATSARGAGAAKGGWLVRTRLSLLAAASALAAAAATASAIRALDILGGPSYQSDVSSIKDGAIASVILAGVGAVVALAVGGWAAAALIRSVLRPLDQLRTGAVELAEVRLPDALRSGGRGPLAVRSVGVSSSDEIGQIARAFDQVQAEVLGVTSDEAGLRGKLGEMFVELSTRSQTLVDRQIRLIDELERGEQDVERRASLVKMDRIATRMRRYSQNLLILAGHELPGEWSRPVTLVDVLRAAVSQIEDYERVSLSAQPGVSVSGPAVKDVVHLLAELADNAASLSAAGTQVDISGRTLASGGVLVDVTDQGVGMHPEVMVEANRRLDSPPAMDVAVSRNMGLFVVGRLAARHGIKVRLQPAATGGLTALVWLPDAVASGPEGAAGAPGFDSADTGPSRGAHAASRSGLPTAPRADRDPSLDRDPSGRDALAQSMWSAPVLEDVRPAPSTSTYPASQSPSTSAYSASPSLSTGSYPASQSPATSTYSASQSPATGAHPASSPAASAASVAASRHAWPDTGLQPRLHPQPSSPAEPVRTQPSSLPQRLVASPRPAPAQPATAESAHAQSPAASVLPSTGLDTLSGPEAGFVESATAAADVAAAEAGERRLPIYEAVESDWFGNRRKQAGGSLAPEADWTMPADPGWGAAQAAARPASSGTTAAGLPVRSPRANLVPGTFGSSAFGSGATPLGAAGTAGTAGGAGTAGTAGTDKPPIPRSASAVRDRLTGFQRGTSQGRAFLSRDDEDQAP